MYERRSLASSALAVIALATLATGCGASETGVDPEDLCPPASTGVTPGTGGFPAPNPGGGAIPGGGAPAGAILQGMGQAWQAVTTFSAKYELRETKGSEVETAKVSFMFKKPGKYRYEVAQHTESIKNGSTSVFDTRSRQITSRLGGVASFIPIKGTLDDARSKSVRGWTLDQTDYATQVEMFLAPGAAVTQGPAMAGSPPALDLARPARYNGSIELMRATLDPQRMLPVQIEMMAGGQVVYRKRFTSLQVNPSLSADKFSL
jgi:outer membrane lipoprotein-sorting protein